MPDISDDIMAYLQSCEDRAPQQYGPNPWRFDAEAVPVCVFDGESDTPTEVNGMGISKDSV